MEKVVCFLKKNSFSLFCIILGLLIFYWVKDYPKVPSGIGPAFFPKIVASLLIGFSLLCLVSHKGKKNVGEVNPDKEAVMKIGGSAVFFIFSTVLMQQVNVFVGIFFFLVAYLKLIAGEGWLKTLVVSIVGLLLFFVTIAALRIPM